MKRVITGWVPTGETLKETYRLGFENSDCMYPKKRKCEEMEKKKAQKRRITIIVEDVE